MKKRNVVLGIVFLLFLVMGVNAIASSVSVTQNTPTASSYDADRIVNFSCSATPVFSNVTNMTLYIDGVLNATRVLPNNVNTTVVYNFTVTFGADSCTGRVYSCAASNNETNRTTTANITFYIDATNPTASCDWGTTYTVINRGERVKFTTADNCGVASRSWTKDGGTTTSSIFSNTDDVDTGGWGVNDYTVTETATDNSGLTASASCSIRIRGGSSQVAINVPEGAAVSQSDGTTTLQQGTPQQDSTPILIVMIVAIVLVILWKKSSRKKR